MPTRVATNNYIKPPKKNYGEKNSYYKELLKQQK